MYSTQATALLKLQAGQEVLLHTDSEADLLLLVGQSIIVVEVKL